MKGILGRGSAEDKSKEKLNKSLLTAAQSGDVDNIRHLLDQGADVNYTHKNETALLAATTHKHSEAVRLLLERGADVQTKNKKGKTATDIAKENADKKTIFILSSVSGDIRVFNLLESMGLLEHWEKFLKEEIKYEDLEGYAERDLEQLGIPKGPRGRLLNYFSGESNTLQPERAMLGHSDQGPRAGSLIAAQRPGLGLGRGSSHSMVELPVPGRSNTFTTKRSPDVPDRRSLPLTRFPEPRSSPPAPTASDHYGSMPKLTASVNSNQPTSPHPQFQIENHYVAAPEFVPEQQPQQPRNNSRHNSSDLGQYAAVNDGGTDYADVVDESDYATANGTDDNDHYAAPPDLQPEGETSNPTATTPTTSHKDNDFDSSSYREINYSELVLEEEIGRGAFGSVFRGTWRGAPVAIKKLHSFSISDPHMVAEFRREASMMQLVGNHPNIVKFVGACSKEEPYCLVSLFCSNGSLESFLKKEKLTPVLEAKILMEIAAGVLHLHCEGVIHRDLAARNVLVGDNYQVYITDFGFARIKEAGNAFNTTKSTIGPVKYMAPESLRDKKYSEKTDAFSFGVVLWEILNPGKVPYEGEDLLKIAMAVITQKKRLPIPENASPTYKKLMEDCWQENPDLRPNFQEIYKRLYDNYKELSGSSKSPATPHATTPSPTAPHVGGGAPRGLPPPRGKPGPAGPGRGTQVPRGAAAAAAALGAGRAKPPAPGRPTRPNPGLVEATTKPQPTEQQPQQSPPQQYQPPPQQQPPQEQQPQQSPPQQQYQPPQQQPPQEQQPQQPPPQQHPQQQQPPQEGGGYTSPPPVSFPAPHVIPNNYASYTPAPTYAAYGHEAYPPQPTSYTPQPPTPTYQPPAYTPQPTSGYASYTPAPPAPAPYDYNAHYAATGGYASYAPQPVYTPPPNYAPTGYAAYGHEAYPPQPTYGTGYPTGYATLPSNYP